MVRRSAVGFPSHREGVACRRVVTWCYWLLPVQNREFDIFCLQHPNPPREQGILRAALLMATRQENPLGFGPLLPRRVGMSYGAERSRMVAFLGAKDDTGRPPNRSVTLAIATANRMKTLIHPCTLPTSGPKACQKQAQADERSEEAWVEETRRSSPEGVTEPWYMAGNPLMAQVAATILFRPFRAARSIARVPRARRCAPLPGLASVGPSALKEVAIWSIAA